MSIDVYTKEKNRGKSDNLGKSAGGLYAFGP